MYLLWNADNVDDDDDNNDVAEGNIAVHVVKSCKLQHIFYK